MKNFMFSRYNNRRSAKGILAKFISTEKIDVPKISTTAPLTAEDASENSALKTAKPSSIDAYFLDMNNT
jgi:hypothetical protein